MAVDLKKNKDSLVKAYQQVFDDKDDTDWVLYGYEGQTPILKVVGTGDGGIDEMAEDLSSGKMMYAYCRVTDPNTGLPKYVLIHWTGESVPENLKLKYTSHLRDVQAFLRGIHLTVPARNEDDVDTADIMKKIAKASGANYSFHQEKAKPAEINPDPVGTDYKRIIPTREININNRDKFWAEAEKEEVSRQKEERERAEEERKKLDSDRKEREEVEQAEIVQETEQPKAVVEIPKTRETKEREKRISEHMRDVNKQRIVEKKADEQNKEVEKRKWEQIQKESSIDEEERGHRSDQMRKERAAEAAQLTSSSSQNARDFFKQKSVERPESAPKRGPPPPRKLQHGFGAVNEPEPPAPRQPIQLPREEAPPSKPVRQPDPEPEPEPEPEPQQTFEPEPEPEPVAEPTPASPVTHDLLRQGLPQRQDSDAEEDDQDWDEPSAEDYTFRENRVPSFHEDYSAEQQHAESESQRVSTTQHFVEDEQPEADAQAPPAEVASDQGLCAQALYDYQAADDTEITFDPDDMITNIVQIDDGWWQGFAPNGSYGMFPANYVELIN